MEPYKKPESDVVVAGADAGLIEKRRQLMMKSFLLSLATAVIALIIFAAVGGKVGATVGGLIYVVAAISGLVSFVAMLMLTSSLHGGGWVAANLIGSLIVPLYSLVALLMLNSQAKSRTAGAAA